MFQADYRSLAALSAVIEEQSFTDGARRLRMTQSAVSQRIRQLEAMVGGPVLIRSTPPRLTEVGEALMRTWRQMEVLENELSSEMRREGKSGARAPAQLERRTISVGVNSDSLATWFFAAAAPAIQRYDLLIRCTVTYEELTQGLLRTGQVFACVSADPKPMGGCRAVPLGEMRYRCVAAPEFRKRFFGKEVTRDAILAAPAALFGQHDTIIYRYFEKHFRARGVQFPHHVVPSTEGFLQVALAGVAHAMIPEVQALPFLRTKELVDLTPDRFVGVKLYWHCWDVRTPSLEALTSSIEKSCKKFLARPER